MSRELIRPEQFRHVKTKSLEQAEDLAFNEAQYKELADLFEGIFKDFEPGKMVKGSVVTADSDGVLVDIGFKSRGLIPKYEFTEHELKAFKQGQEIEVMLDTLESPEGEVVLSYEKAKAARAWKEIIDLFEQDKPVQGLVAKKVKGGLQVDIGIPAFLPGSQIDLQRVTDFDHWVGQTITAKIIKVNQKRGNVIISRRKYMNDQRSTAKKKVLEILSEGQTIQGVVKNITNYGAFIDIGGVDGLLHITDMTWGRIAHPSELVKIGQTITVKVLSYDKENEKISLGLKQLDPNPWDKVADKLEVGKKIKGKISSITDYGLFVELAPDVEGLVHISEISWTDRINDLDKLYKVGSEVEVLIVSLDKDNRRMSLSIKQLEKNPWEFIEEKYKVGDKTKGKVSNLTDFGIFVQLMPGVDGLVHVSDISWTEHIEHPSDRYTVGDEVEAVILDIDKENKKLSLGIKQLTEDPWSNIDQLHKVNDMVDGQVVKVGNYGAIIKLPTDLEGILANSVIEQETGKRADQLYKLGDTIQVRIANVNKKDHKISLSTLAEGSAPKERPAREKKTQSRDNNNASKVKNTLQMALENAFKSDDDKE